MDYSAFHWSEKARKQAERAKEIVDSIGSVLHYKGSVETRADLPITGQVLGDMYNITSDGSNVVWNGSDWDDISGIVDLSAYRTASDQDTIDAGKVPTTRTVNGKALSSNISLTASDVGALPDSTVIPTVNNATLTIQKNGTSVATFTANSSTNATANITVPTDTGDLSNGAGFITGITSSDVTTALGYTPYDASNPNGYTSNVGTVTSVNNVSPVSGNVTLSIPTVNNPTITITQGGVTKGSFTLNQSTVDTIALDAGGGSPLPSQTGNSGKFLTTDGTDASWGVPKTHNLFDFIWRDAELNDMAWLRADTFSWQDGTVYSNAYNHLVDDVTNGTSQTETIAGITIGYYLSPDGHKIVDGRYAQGITDVEAIYNATGVAWYYILDTTNQRFKLPRTKYGFVGLRDTVGKYVPESLPNIKGSFKADDYIQGSGQQQTGCFYITNNATTNHDRTSAAGTTNVLENLDASLSSSAYQDNAPVQQRATQMYLYFYVGQFSQSATEQTAGLNSSLFNGKVDLNAANLSIQGKSLISGLCMPSNRYIDLTPGASGSIYQMPANGYVCVGVTHPDNANWEAIGVDVLDSNDVFLFNVGGTYNLNNQSYWFLVPVQNGFKVQVWSNGFSISRLRFIYAEGEPNV